jgi:Ca2+-binding RTX toxin-like protein
VPFVIVSGAPIVGTYNSEFIVPDENVTLVASDVIDAAEGDDLVIGDAGHIHILESDVQNSSISTAYSLDDLTTWSTAENQLFGNSAIPHTTAIVNAFFAQNEYFSVTVGAGQQLIVDIDFGADTGIGFPTDETVEILDAAGNVLQTSFDSLTTDGGLGSFPQPGQSGSLISSDPYATYTPGSAGTYYILVRRDWQSTQTFMLNVSVSGHAVGLNPVQGNDTINGGWGADVLLGLGGDDVINGGPGKDLISGGTGNNTVHGNDGDDTIYVDGEGHYFGDAGDDTFIAGTNPGAILDGGSGRDTLDLTRWTGDLIVDLALGFTSSGESYSNIERIITGEGNHTITGSDSADIILTNSGSDTIRAGAGNDVISGGFGHDRLTGGAGKDTFLDTVAKLNGDTITDLSNGDTIVLTDANVSGFSYSIVGNSLIYSGGVLDLQQVPVGRVIMSTGATSNVQLKFFANPHNDLNGDGRSDILWRNDDGGFATWLGNASGEFTPAWGTAVSNDWKVAGTGDFNGDGRNDVLWRNDDGAIADWLGASSGGFTPGWGTIVTTDWKVTGVGDFNGDGRDDILWRNDNGAMASWLSAGNGGFTQAFGTVVSNDWAIVATGDCNGDGRDDIIWRSTSGAFADWLSSGDGGFTPAWGTNFFGTALPFTWHAWKVVGTGDFDGNGFDEFLMRTDDDALYTAIGKADGSFGFRFISTVAAAQTIVSIGDFNGDGYDDILWQSDTGQLTRWLGQRTGGFTDTTSTWSVGVSADWHVQDPFS